MSILLPPPFSGQPFSPSPDSAQIMDKPGVHGKLPGHGDFVTRRLSQEFVTAWDDWLQRALSCSQELLGADWLEIYLTSPVWRFVLSPGVVDARVWAGVMIPSVDRVGRYYPLTLAQSFAATALPTALLVEQGDWFGELESAALAGLQDGVTIDELDHWLRDIATPALVTPASAAVRQWEVSRPLALFLQQPGQNPLSTYPVLLHDFLLQRFPSYSLWWSAGSERVSPASLMNACLPSPQCYTALLAGDWEQRGWAIPFPAIAPLPASAFPHITNDPVQNE